MKAESTIYKKLYSLKGKIGKISKDSKNPFYKSKYFDINSLLENVEPLMHENNLVLLQPILNNKVTTKIIDSETGEEISSEIELPTLNDPQKLGSAITYYRRYTLQSLLGIQAEDDDANRASGKTANAKPWINDQQLAKALERIQAGETGLIEKLQKSFKMRDADIAKLQNLQTA